MSLYKISKRGVLARSLYKISIRGLLARLLKRSLHKRSEGSQRKISVQALYKRSLSKIAARFTRSLYKISVRGLLQDLCTRSLSELCWQGLRKRSLGKISEQDLHKRSLGKISLQVPYKTTRGLLARFLYMRCLILWEPAQSKFTWTCDMPSKLFDARIYRQNAAP